jgi:hypothetical protein
MVMLSQTSLTGGALLGWWGGTQTMLPARERRDTTRLRSPALHRDVAHSMVPITLRLQLVSLKLQTVI